MGELVGMLLLLGLAIFIVWESRRFHSKKPDPLPRERMAKGFSPGRDAADLGILALVAMCVFFGIKLWNSPEHPPFQGRWALFETMVYALFGPRGVPVIAWVSGAILFSLLVAKRFRK